MSGLEWNLALLPGKRSEHQGAKGCFGILRDDPHLRNGLNACEGHVTYPAVAEHLGAEHVESRKLVQ